MDCCGMPMAAWPGGGLVCRKCQAKVGVSWSRDRNPFARCVENPVVEDMAPEPEPEVVDLLSPQARVDFSGIGSLDVVEAAGPAPDEPKKFHVGEVKQSGIGRLGRKGGSK